MSQSDSSEIDSSMAVKFLQEYDRFRETFEQHEEAELKLILDAIDDDIGVGD